GEYEPRNVALGTRGSELLGIGDRMREEFFLRWTHSPLRIVPGMEMPSYTKPVPGVLGGDLDAQLRTVWKALNDPRFTAPTNPSAVEQFLVIKPGEPPRIVRDVFTLPKGEGEGYVARAFAVGLNNGHNVLFDLDTFTVRGWTFGDFARQRTEGKSWYWDMAGISVMTGLDEQSDFALRRRGDETLIFPKADESQCGRLVSYRTTPAAVILEYELNLEFQLGTEGVRTVNLYEVISPFDDGERAGWQRRIELRTSLPDGHDVVVFRPKPRNGLGSPRVEAIDARQEWESAPDAQREFLPIPITPVAAAEFPNAVPRTVVLRYSSSLKRELPASSDRLDRSARPPLIPPSEGGRRQDAEELRPEPVTTVPGFDGVRLPLDRSIMPTAIAWTNDGTLAFTSLKGHVYLARDTDGDGMEDTLSVFEEGLAAPYGIIADGNALIVAHKPELLKLEDTDGDGRADLRTVLATGWGYSDNYHDWTCGIVRDGDGNLYVGLGSDYAQPERPRDRARWRGKVLKIS
ncbi:MAG: DUF7133 domain-containing protein, partial [Planctomycetaceae bacterium]